MKRVFLLSLCLAVCLGLLGCGRSEAPEQTAIASEGAAEEKEETRSQKLDYVLPQIAEEYGLEAADFEKQEIKGGEYYYEAHTEDQGILRLVSETGLDEDGIPAIYAVLYQVQNDETMPDFQESQKLAQYQIPEYHMRCSE